MPRHVRLHSGEVPLRHRSRLRLPSLQPLHNLRLQRHRRPTLSQNALRRHLPYHLHLLRHLHPHSRPVLHVQLLRHAPRHHKLLPRLDLPLPADLHHLPPPLLPPLPLPLLPPLRPIL
ncbi:hypothetical protein VIGAN_01088000 [Vigna angularis var. angularis]|uniref:Uncharacterized protein n=1 Tax=Vigna angularis var. angularis TaxID=157739 RepID=A0A0S3QYH0_PHAAN|nr:hypothetical protein VIGAN_01088000 [Vigna angularis var. angularis]